MKLLFGQNLSRHLVRQPAEEFPDSLHVTDVNLATASDREIWDFAGDNGLMIVSMDSDFRQFAFLLGPPPKALWRRVGNASTASIRNVLSAQQETIAVFNASEDEALLVLSPDPKPG